ncbi:MAG: hypothetical protein WC558_07045 [Patulibacter sp.]
MVRKFQPDAKIPDSPIYWQVYRHCKALAKAGYVRLEKREYISTQKTFDLQEKEQCETVHNAFASRLSQMDNQKSPINAFNLSKPAPPIVSCGTLPTETKEAISTVKIKETAFTVVPTENLFALISRVQNSNQFLRGAKGRREMQEVRENAGINFAKLKIQKKRRPCPYYVSVRTRTDRMDAIFRLQGIRRHSMFKRRDQKVLNDEMIKGLAPVQVSFEKYMETIEGLQITLQNKESGEIKFIDYQTRFTDETRKDGTIARYHRVWNKAGDCYNTGVLLTLTSYPPSEVPKHFHRQSLRHVDRHFGPAWNAFMSKLTKRNRAIRRDELLDLKRMEIEKIRSITLKQERCWHCEGTGKVKGVTKATKIRTCPRCKGKGHLMKIALTKAERTEALLPMSKKYLCDLKLEEILKTEPDRIELTEDEIAEVTESASFRPRYLQVYEFQKNGLLHSHVAIFGKSYLAYWEDIALDWMKTGQGERIHVYGIQKQGNTWVWLKEQPKDARNRQPVDYLGKYLGKGVKTRSGYGMYFAINKRFFTNSRVLETDRELPDKTEKIESTYEFIGTTRNDEVPVWLRTLHTAREKGKAGYLDALGWSRGDPGGALA